MLVKCLRICAHVFINLKSPTKLYSVFQLGIFLRALRPARTGLRPARFTQHPARKIKYIKQNFNLQNVIAVVFSADVKISAQTSFSSRAGL